MQSLPSINPESETPYKSKIFQNPILRIDGKNVEVTKIIISSFEYKPKNIKPLRLHEGLIFLLKTFKNLLPGLQAKRLMVSPDISKNRSQQRE